MIDLKTLQKNIYKNKIEKGFVTNDVNIQFCFLHEELSEAFRAYRKKLPDLGEELADVAIYLLGLAELLNIDLEKEIKNKVEKNKKRKYKKVNGKLVRTKDG